MLQFFFFHRNKLWFAATVPLLSVFLFGIPGEASAAIANWQKGATILPQSSTDYSSVSFEQSVRNLQATHANYVTLDIPLVQSDINSTDVATSTGTPTDQSLIDGIDFIHSLGMHVALKFQVTPDDGNWSAYIDPSDRATWFANYGTILAHYAGIAQSNGVEEMILGTELIDMSTDNANPTNTTNWLTLIARMRSLYSGKLTYDANWGGDDFANETANVKFWSALDYIGISAYFNLPGDTSAANLAAQWNTWNETDIGPLEQEWNKPILFTEIGYMSLTTSNQNPWMWWQTGSADEGAQANDYQALFSYWNNVPYMAGVQLWNWSSNPDAGGANDIGYTPQNKQAQAVMTTWFGDTEAATGPTPTSTLASDQALNIWWPINGATVSDVQPFKAMITNDDPSNYTMYWQVDGGQLNPMADNATDYPHKEASVDVSTWYWRGGAAGTGPYVINFVAKDPNGNTIAEESSTVMVGHY